MLFNSATFIFGFLPVVLLGSLVLSRLPNRICLHLWLFVSSLFFYAWWNPAYLPLILGSIAFNYIVGKRLLEKPDRRLLALGIGANLLLLGYFKYTGFLIENANAVFSTALPAPDIILPLGISFFTFQKIAFLVDCHRKKIAGALNLLNFGLFVSFFPQLISGPIVHHAEMMPQFNRQKAIGGETVAAGLSLFALGLFKKIFIADSLGLYATTLFGVAETRELAASEAWIAMLAYTFQIYFDFSGYSDMALGLGKMLGIRLPLNFFSPYKAASIIDFWRRWHMTLSRFLRDYLYIPLGGNRKGQARRYLNLMITMLLGGLWHGASWTFVIWGGLHGAYLAINHMWQSFSSKRLPSIAAHMLTFFAVAVAWIFFRAPDERTAFAMIRSLFSFGGLDPYQAFFTAQSPLRQSFSASDANLALPLVLVCALICAFAPNSVEIMRKSKPFFGMGRGVRLEKSGLVWSPGLKWGILAGGVFGICLLKVLYEPSNVFLYFQF